MQQKRHAAPELDWQNSSTTDRENSPSIMMGLRCFAVGPFFGPILLLHETVLKNKNAEPPSLAQNDVINT